METEDFLAVDLNLNACIAWTWWCVCVCVCVWGGGVVVGIMKHHLYNARDERRVEWIHGLRKGGMEESNSVLT